MWSQWWCERSNVASTGPVLHQRVTQCSNAGTRIEQDSVVSPQTSSTELVLPPTPAVSGPGDAMLPRTPQNRMFIVMLIASTRDVASRVPGEKRRDFVPGSAETLPIGAPAAPIQDACISTWTPIPMVARAPIANIIVRNGCRPHR